MRISLESKDKKFLEHCVSGAAVFSTCAKRQFMAILVDRYGMVIGTGYNGVPSGLLHCSAGGCPRFLEDVKPGGNYNNCLAIHAEANALLHSDYTARRDGVTLYVNGTPCFDCAKLIANSGVQRVVYIHDDDRGGDVNSFFEKVGIEVVVFVG